MLLGIALLCIMIAIPLMILPGPAILFYLIAGFLIAGESRWMAALFDFIELSARHGWRRWRDKRRRKRLRAP